MTFAIHYCPNLVAERDAFYQCLLKRGVAILFLGVGLNLFGQGSSSSNNPALRAEAAYHDARRQHLTHPDSEESAWYFARACFDWAEFATNDNQRSKLAEEGIKVSRARFDRSSNSCPAHYYLGMNLGQLARTRSLGALPLVDEMEIEFKAARVLDENWDYAGPDRNLGLLYLEAPTFASIGSRTKARIHLKRALELAPEYPENRLNLIEALLRWRDFDGASRELATYDAAREKAKNQFAGERWTAAWEDWTRRSEKARDKLLARTKRAASPRDAP